MAAIGRFFQALFLLALAVLAIALVGFHFFTSQFDDELRSHVVRQLRQQFPNHIVNLRAARRVPGAGIELRAVTIATPLEGRADSQMIYIEEAMLGCDTDFAQLMTGETRMFGVKLRGVKVRATRDASGWDVTSLIGQKKSNVHCPGIAITDGTLEIIDEQESPSRQLVMRNVEVNIQHHANEADVRVADDVEAAFQINGSFTTDFAQKVTLAAALNQTGTEWDIEFQASGVDISAKLANYLPSECDGYLRSLGHSSATADIRGRATSAPSAGGTPLFEVRGRLYDGRVEHAALAFTPGQITADFVANNSGIQIKKGTARQDDTQLTISGNFFGYRPGSPLKFHLSAQKLPLDKRLASSLPSNAKTGWQKFSPAGIVNAEFDIEFDGRTWHRDLYVDCVDVSFMYDKFPYRLENGRGQIRFLDNTLSMKGFIAHASGRPVRIDADFANLGPDVTGWIEFQLDDPVALDEKLLVALDEKTENAIRALKPSGHIIASGRLERATSEERFHKVLQIGLQKCWITYERVPYPLHSVDGVVKVVNDSWSFEKLTGQNDTAYIECSGGWVPNDPNQGLEGGVLALDISAWDVPLEEELRNALPPGVQRVWTAIHPRGTIDHLTIHARYNSVEKDLQLDVVGDKWPPQQNVEGRSLRIEPEWFPYSMDDVTGTIHYRNGIVELHDLKGVHGNCKLEATGTCEFDTEGRWALQFTKILADRIRVDRDLTSALPGRLGEAISKLNLTGPISMDGPPTRPGRTIMTGRQALELYGGPNEPIRASWNLAFDVEQGGLDCGVKFEHIHGYTILVGDFDGQSFASRGELNIDSLTHRDIQITELRGPFQIDNTKVTFGRMVPAVRMDEAPRSLLATALRGTVEFDAEVSLADDLPFRLRGSIFNGDLAVASREITSHSRDITGRLHGEVRLSGTSKGAHTFRGDGNMQIMEASLYELPVMARMLKLLRVRQPDRSAFTSGDTRFRIEGDHLYFDTINFHGDVISLREGTGELDFHGRVNLQFYTMVGREEFQIPVLQMALREASPRILMVHVKGTLEDPVIERELFRELNEQLKQLFPEVAQRRASGKLLRPFDRNDSGRQTR